MQMVTGRRRAASAACHRAVKLGLEETMSAYVCNVFTIAMAPAGGHIEYQQLSAFQARDMLMRMYGGWKRKEEVIQAVGHEQTVALANASLGCDAVSFARISVQLKHGDQLIVCQYVGPRLPEGVTVLPEGAEIRWYLVNYETIEGHREDRAREVADEIRRRINADAPVTDSDGAGWTYCGGGRTE
jgi:hypothetical protein